MQLVVILFLLFSFTSASKILFTVLTSSKSHLGSMLPLAQALSKHGHDVTVYVETVADLGVLKGVKSHYVTVSEHIFHNMEIFTPFMEVMWNHDYNPHEMFTSSSRMGILSFLEAVKQDSFWQIANQTWDLIIGNDISTPAGWGLGMMHKEKYGTPYAVCSTTIMLQTFTTVLSLNRNPVISPSYFMSQDEPLSWHTENFIDRMIAMRHAVFEYIVVGHIVDWVTHFVLKQMNCNNFSWFSYYQDLSIVFSDYPERIAWPTPTGNEFVFTGSSTCRDGNPLPADLEEFVSDPKSKGTILIAFGSLVLWDLAPRRIVNALLEAVNNMTDYRIIWGYKGMELAVKGHVKLMGWMPQYDLLNHPKTKLFISHGGLKSVKEAICSATPVLYMPLVCEQTRSALIAKQLGFAEYLNKKTVDAPKILSQMTKILSENSFRKAVTKVKSFFVDRIVDSLEEAVFWSEKMIRYGRSQLTFRRAGMKLYWLQFLYADIAVLLISVVLFFGSMK